MRAGWRAMPFRESMSEIETLEAAPPEVRSSVRRLLRILGLGFITGASDDDPSVIGTYASVGAAFGFAVLWLAPASFPLMAAVQYICAKVDLVCGTGLAGALRRHYPAECSTRRSSPSWSPSAIV